jgi:glycosyltransferase involved in cell wall biosynthesis
MPFSKLFSTPRRLSDDRIAGLSVFLPCHNEEGNVQRVVEALECELPKISAQHEIVVVDDGSRDRTGEIADRLAAANPNVKVVHHPINRGYGAAVISGIHACTQPWVVLCDGDGQFAASDISRLEQRDGLRRRCLPTRAKRRPSHEAYQRQGLDRVDGAVTGYPHK